MERVVMSSERSTGDFGAKLRQARERRGLSLRQIANTTKIPMTALEALERNDLARLPGGIFSRAFVRSYAVQVGLDPNATMEEFVAQFPRGSISAGRSPSVETDENERIESDRRAAVTMLRLVALSIPIVGFVLYLGARSRPAAPETAPDDAEQAAQVLSPAAEPAPAAGTPETSIIPTASVGALRATDGERRPDAGTAQTLTVALEATGPCWVSAVVDGVEVMARELAAGDRRVLEVTRDIELKIGDPGALQVTLNGVRTRPLGTAGQTVTRRFTPASFQQYLATP